MGSLSPDLEGETLYWRLVVDGNRQLAELEGWDLEDFHAVFSFTQMKADYTRAGTQMSMAKIKEREAK